MSTLAQFTTAIYGHYNANPYLAENTNGLFLGRAPTRTNKGKVTPPYVVYDIISNDREFLMGNTANENTLVQFSIFSANAGTTEIMGIYEAFINHFDDADLMLGSGKSIKFLRSSEVWQPDEDIASGSEFGWNFILDYDAVWQG